VRFGGAGGPFQAYFQLCSPKPKTTPLSDFYFLIFNLNSLNDKQKKLGFFLVENDVAIVLPRQCNCCSAILA